MTTLEKDVIDYFKGARHPGRQIAVVSELCGISIAQVIEILQREGVIPKDVNLRNYKKLKRDRLEGGLSEEERRYIIGSMKTVETIANELHLPVSVVFRIRKEAFDRAKEGNKKNER